MTQPDTTFSIPRSSDVLDTNQRTKMTTNTLTRRTIQKDPAFSATYVYYFNGKKARRTHRDYRAAVVISSPERPASVMSYHRSVMLAEKAAASLLNSESARFGSWKKEGAIFDVVQLTLSWAPEVQTASCAPDSWTGNALRFATKEEAEQYVFDLSMRWTAVRDTRVVESSDPVNYAIRDNALVRLEGVAS